VCVCVLDSHYDECFKLNFNRVELFSIPWNSPTSPFTGSTAVAAVAVVAAG